MLIKVITLQPGLSSQTVVLVSWFLAQSDPGYCYGLFLLRGGLMVWSFSDESKQEIKTRWIRQTVEAFPLPLELKELLMETPKR